MLDRDVQSPLDTVLYQSPVLTVGDFAVRPEDPRFRDSGPIETYPVVFPGTPVVIRHRAGPPILTDRTRVLLYNRHQRYTREAVIDEGDRCHWFSFQPEIVAGVSAEVGVDPDPDRPFRVETAPCDAETFLIHRLVRRHLARRAKADCLFVEETLLALLGRILAQAHGFNTAPSTIRHSNPDHRDLAERVKVLLAAKYRESLSLADIAGSMSSSPFHLSRVFRRQIGSSIHAYRHQLRLRAGLEQILETRRDLTDIGLSLGFSSHSHFTQAFRRNFGLTPSAARRHASRQLLEHWNRTLSGVRF